MKKRKQYPDDFKAEAAAMVIEQGRSIADVCQSLGVGPTALRRWVQARSGSEHNNTMSQSKTKSAEQQRISELENEVVRIFCTLLLLLAIGQVVPAAF